MMYSAALSFGFLFLSNLLLLSWFLHDFVSSFKPRAIESHSRSLTTTEPIYRKLPPLRQQAEIQDAWADERLKQVPTLLRKYGVDAWLLAIDTHGQQTSQREHAEDTVFFSMRRATQFAARRRTIQLFVTTPSNTNLIGHGTSLSSTMLLNGGYAYNWVDNTPQIWSDLNNTLHLHNPTSIALNLDPTIVFSGGMHVGEFNEIKTMLGDGWVAKTKVIPMLGVEFVATRVDSQLEWYRKMQETAWAMVSEAFSEKVIVPGTTTSQDLSWWFRDKIQSLNYSTWNMPRVSVVHPSSFPGNDIPHDMVVNYGDMLHVDFGLTALGLNTDTQHLGYVLYPGQTENDIPESFKEGLKKSNSVQDIVRTAMKPGLSGNQVLESSLRDVKNDGIEGRVYCHPIGDWGHSAGALIGMTNLQYTVPIPGDLPLLPNTYYSIEIFAEHFVPERNATFKFMQEENVYWDEGTQMWEYVWARQEKFHIVRTKKMAGSGDKVMVNQHVLQVSN